ncbi:MAG TPA: hypothetical protein VK137_06565, partial [Planctomycetaceae bacterium]|nr:hypothetical protein [Planctomycetaceae bacterium]
EANSVLDSFTAGLDDVVYDIAERIARQRNPSVASPEIDVEDVKKAAEIVLQGVRDAVARGQLPSDFETVLNEMRDSFHAECERS